MTHLEALFLFLDKFGVWTMLSASHEAVVLSLIFYVTFTATLPTQVTITHR